jgi:hypothetical protein
MFHKIASSSPAHALPVVEGPSHEEIAERAFRLFEARGGGAGHDLDDWLQAEQQLLHERIRRAGVFLIEEDPLRPLAEPAWV